MIVSVASTNEGSPSIDARHKSARRKLDIFIIRNAFGFITRGRLGAPVTLRLDS